MMAGEAGGSVTVVAAIAAVSVGLLGLQFMEKLACWRPVLQQKGSTALCRGTATVVSPGPRQFNT